MCNKNMTTIRFRGGAMEFDPIQVLTPLPKPSLGSRVIHISDLQDFCTCKRKWNWASMLRRGLQPSVSPAPLMFGSAIHYALDHGYRECIGEDHAHFDLKTGLRAFRHWMRETARRTVEYTGELWDFEKDAIKDMLDLGLLMLRHYALWAAPLDKLFRMIGTEYKFRVPLPGHEEHGMEYAGRFDGLVEDLHSGTRYILEFKTSKSIRSYMGGRSSNVQGVLRGMQSAAYTWASGQVYDEPAHGVLYRFMLKRAPDLPKPLQAGGYSRAKSIKSTVAWYQYILRKVAEEKAELHCNGEGSPEQVSEVTQTYYESEVLQAAGALAILRERQEVQGGYVVGNDFFAQIPMVKKDRQVQDVLAALGAEGLCMTNPDQPIYPTSGFHCNWCSFKAPCDLIAYGYEDQVEDVLAASYGPRTYWEPEVEDEY